MAVKTEICQIVHELETTRCRLKKEQHICHFKDDSLTLEAEKCGPGVYDARGELHFSGLNVFIQLTIRDHFKF